MSAPHVEVVRRFKDAMAAHDIVTATTLLATDVVCRVGADGAAIRAPGSPTEYVGHAGFARMIDAFAQVWERDAGRRRYDHYECVDGGGDRVFHASSATIRSRATGALVDLRALETITVTDGLITELVPYYYDTLRLIEAARGRRDGQADR